MRGSGALAVALAAAPLCLLGACGYDGPADGAAEAAGSPEAGQGTTTSVAAAGDDAVAGDPLAAGGVGATETPTVSEARGAVPAAALEGMMPRTVAVVGDSLTESAVAQIEDALVRAGVRDVLVDGLPSRKMVAGSSSLPPGIDAIDGILGATTPDAWVIALGTNDVAAAHGPDRIAADILTVIEAIPDGVPLVWVDVHMRDREDETGWANMLIAHQVGRRPNSIVVSWDEYVDAHDGMIADDGVHLSGSGREAFAQLMADGLVEFTRG